MILLEEALNSCNFIGYFLEDPDLEEKYLFFYLEIVSYRKSKSGDKIKSKVILPFEAWDSGAETIAKIGRKGSKIAVSCTARNYEEDGQEFVVFRVNEFDFGCNNE